MSEAEAESEFLDIKSQLEQADRDLVAALEARAAACERYIALRRRFPDGYRALPTTVDVVRRTREMAKRYPSDSLLRIMREVVGTCLSMVAPVRVGVLGTTGGFAAGAARRHFGSQAELLTLDRIAAVFEEVERKRCSFGIVPLETSSDGAVSETLERLLHSEVRICAEVAVSHRYDLFSATGDAERVAKIYATGATIAACERSVHQLFPQVELVDVTTPELALRLAGEDDSAAALTSALAVAMESDAPGRADGSRAETPEEASALVTVHTHLEDEAGVATRFAIVGHAAPARTGSDRTLLALSVHDQPGALHTVLRPFAERSINLTHIESRPSQTAGWGTVFVLELDGHVTDRPLLTTIDRVRSDARHLKVLGSYPRPEQNWRTFALS